MAKPTHRLVALRKFRSVLEAIVDNIKTLEKDAEANVMTMFLDDDDLEKVTFRMKEIESVIADEVATVASIFTSGGSVILEAPKKEITVYRKRDLFAQYQIPRDDVTIALADEPLTAQFVKLAFSDQSLNKFLREQEESGAGIPPSLQHALSIGERWKAGITGLGLRTK